MQDSHISSKKKVALLFSGQVRNIPANEFNAALKQFTKYLDVDIYLSYWSEPGVSMGHNLSKIDLKPQPSFSLDPFLDEAFQGFHIKARSSESGELWRKTLSSDYVDILNDSKYSKLTIHALPQLYQIYKSYQLVEKDIESYDIIFRCRYDLLFVLPFQELNCQRNTVYGLNFGRAYHPNRIYDIFFWGDPKAIQSTFKTWIRIPELINKSFNNGLDKRDACRLLYLSTQHEGFNVASGGLRYCDIYRPEKTIYEYYINILHWRLVAKDCPKILRQASKIFFINQALSQIGYLKVFLLYSSTLLRLHKRGTLSYWRKKLKSLNLFS